MDLADALIVIVSACDDGASLSIRTRRSMPILHAHAYIDGGSQIEAVLEPESGAGVKCVGSDVAPVLIELVRRWEQR